MNLRKGATNILKRLSYVVSPKAFETRMQTLFLKALRTWGRRAPAYAGRQPPPSGIIEPQWSYVSLHREHQTHPIQRRIDEAIIRECIRNGGDIFPRFTVKCTVCGQEYDKEVEKCECGGTVRKPNPEQKPILEAFIKNPNRDDEWMTICVSLLRFILSVSDWYLFATKTPSTIDLEPFGYAEKLESDTVQVYVEDSRYIRICADKRGRLGNEEFFCPVCYDGDKADTFYDLNYYKKHGGKCPKCKNELKQTAYIWREVLSTQIKARYHREEIIHGNMDSQLPHLYGVPKTIACLRPLHILKHMTRFDLENYASGKVAKMVIITGMSQDEVNSLVEDAKAQAEDRVERSVLTGQRAPPKLHTLMIGIDDDKATVHVVDAMPDPEKMQNLEKYKQYVEDVCGIYGVTPKFEGIAEAGKQGVRMVIDVENAVAEMYQKSLTDVFDEQLWPKFLGVTDWVWRFNPVEPRDELLDARIKQLNVDTGIKATKAGLVPEIEESGHLNVVGIFKKPEIPEPFGEMPEEGMEVKLPGEQVSTVEEPWKKKGKTWLVKEIEPDN